MEKWRFNEDHWVYGSTKDCKLPNELDIAVTKETVPETHRCRLWLREQAPWSTRKPICQTTTRKFEIWSEEANFTYMHMVASTWATSAGFRWSCWTFPPFLSWHISPIFSGVLLFFPLDLLVVSKPKVCSSWRRQISVEIRRISWINSATPHAATLSQPSF